MPSKYDEFSATDSDDDGFEEDMEALRRACILTGANPNDIQPSTAPTASSNPDASPTYDSEDDDLELVRSIQRRFSVCTDDEEPLNLKPLCSILPGDSDGECEDDFETLRAIQRRFADYNDSQKNSTEDNSHTPKQVGATYIASEKETSNTLSVDETNFGEGFPDSVDASITTHVSESITEKAPETHPSDSIQWHDSDDENLAITTIKGTGFTECARSFFEAIKKNRTCQKFLRSKLMQIEARIEENKKLMERVKILKDFQVTCRKRTGRALSQKRDARVQLISTAKQRSSSKATEKKLPAMFLGPPENPNVANYRMVLTKFPLTLSREKWSKAEKENLAKGIKQQFQEILFHESLKRVRDAEEYTEDSNNIDSIMESIRDLDITPEKLRLFLPQVNWDQLASMYVPGRSGAECRARWLNCEDPLINHGPWTNVEDKNLLHIVQQRGVGNWIDIAVSLGTNRTPFQCLARYQRSLNASIMKREWTEDDDDKLRTAVEEVGETNWQLVASKLEGRTGTQCSNRWKKTLHPMRQRVGTWGSDEDKRLKVAVMLFGARNWKKIANYVPGRTEVQCRERWVNCLDPSLKLGEWTEDEDLKLKDAIAEHGYAWSKVAACVPPRTDSQCRRRWKVLLPHEVPLLQAARKVQKAALISNFVDRESERPVLGPKDFIMLPLLDSVPESDKQRKRKLRQAQEPNDDGKQGLQTRSKRRRKDNNCSEGVLRLTDGNEVDNIGENVDLPRKKRVKRQRSKNTEPAALAKDNGEDNALKKKRGPTRGKRKPASSKPKKNRARKKSRSYISEDSDETNLDDDVQGFCSDDTTENTNACKSSPCNNTCTDEVEVCNGSGDRLAKKRRIKGRSKKYRLIDEEIESPPLVDETFEPMIVASDDDGVGALGGDNNVEEIPIRCTTPDILDSLNARASTVSRRQNRNKKPRRKREKKWSEEIPKKGEEEEDGTDITLASFLKRSSKKCSDEILETEEEDGPDITLALFLKQSNKRRKSDALRSSRVIEGEEDGDDVTLALFSRKLKKQKRKLAKIGI